MPTKKRNIIDYYSWQMLIPQVAIFVALAFVFKLMGLPRDGVLSLSLYLLLSGYLKVMVPKSHRKGLFYIRKGEFEGAVYAFKQSYQFFSRYAWIDEYRAFILLSISKLSYREMALMNMMYCYGKLGDHQNARKAQNMLRETFPNNIYGYRK